MSEGAKAVFLSYASQDSEAAKRIAAALRAAGVEVWFDQSELVGGDAWDAKIRQQIAECALFVPIISANTQARLEGYFRIEWKLAARRTHAMAMAKAFLLPIVIDGTRDAEAHVPDEFRDVQWTRLPGGETAPAFCGRVQRLLSANAGPSSSEAASHPPISASRELSPPRKKSRLWLAPVLLGLFAGLAVVIRQPWRQNENPVRSEPPASASESALIRARLVPDRWQKGDLEALAPTLDRIIQANPEDSDAWALRSITNSLQVTRNIDSGTKPLETGKAAAERARRLAPDSPLAELALGMHLNAMISRGGDPLAGRPHVSRAVAALPPDALTRYADLVTSWQAYNFEDTKRIAEAWLATEAKAAYPNWILAQFYLSRRQPVEAEKWAEVAAADRNVTGTRAIYTQFEAKYYLRADLPAAQEVLARVPPEGRTMHRVVHARWLLAMAGQHWDEALQELARVPEPMFYDRTYHGPRALLAGLAHQRAGRAEAALAQFREAERLLRAELATDADNEELHLVLALTLACAGRPADARSELGFVEPLLKGRVPSIYWGAQVIAIAQTYGVLGDFGRMAEWLRKLFVLPNGFPFTPASLRLDPRFAGLLEAPEIRALLKEFASLDQPKNGVSASGVDEKSVAVLAFANLSEDKGNEYFSDGISEELLNVLAKVPGLKVSARTSAFHFKGKDTPIPEIAQQLGVAYVVEGSVRKAGDKVRITAQLIKAADGFHVWSDTFTRDLKDIFAVQDEIAGLIAQNLRLKLDASGPAKKTVHPEAYALLLEGRFFIARRSEADFVEAEKRFRRALEIDADFAPAFAGIADAAMLRGTYGLMEGSSVQPADFARAREAARRAMELDPTLAEPHHTLGLLYVSERRFAEADREFAAGFRLNPNYGIAYHWRALLTGALGRFDEAIADLERAISLDPLATTALFTYARFIFAAGQTQEALAPMERAIALRPSFFPAAHSTRALFLLRLGRTDEALAEARLVRQNRAAPTRWWADGDALYVLKQAGAPGEAEAYLSELRGRLPADSHLLGYALLAMGESNEAWRLLAGTNPISWTQLFWAPMMEPHHNTPPLRDLFKRLGALEHYDRARTTIARLRQEQEAKK